MKPIQNFTRTLFCFAILVMVLEGCGSKHDYRHRWIGDFHFNTRITYGSTVRQSYDGEIYLGKSGNLVFYYTKGNVLELNVDQDGNLSPYFEMNLDTFSGAFSSRREVAIRFEKGGQVTEIDGKRR